MQDDDFPNCPICNVIMRGCSSMVKPGRDLIDDWDYYQHSLYSM